MFDLVISNNLRTNPQIKPTFEENSVVILTKDYSELDPRFNPSLKKDTCVVVEICGLSFYGYNEKTNDFDILVNDEEWCQVDVGPTEYNLEDSDECVKAEDLRIALEED